MWYLLSRILRIPIRLVDRLSELSMRLTLQLLIPVSLHRYVRDSGGFRLLGDIGAYCAGIGLCIISPQIIRQYNYLRTQMEVFNYSDRYHQLVQGTDRNLVGQDDTMFLEVIPCNPAEGIYRTTKDSPVLVFIHGGGWGSGRPWQYTLSAHNMGLLLHASKVVVVGYPYYPEASILQQRDAVLAALHYVREHRQELGIDSQQPIVLSGHSSGANISALALLQHYLEEEAGGESHHPLVEMYIGLSGIYNTEKQYDHEQDRGCHDLSPLRTSIGPAEFFPLTSPTALVTTRLVSHSQNSKNFSFPVVAVIHGYEDLTVPKHSSEEFEEAVRKLHADDTAVLSYYPDLGHMTPITDLLYQGTWNATKVAIVDSYSKFVSYRKQFFGK